MSSYLNNGPGWPAEAGSGAPNAPVPMPYVVPSAPVIVVQSRGVNHPLHITLSLISFGLWLPVYILIMIFGGKKQQTVVR